MVGICLTFRCNLIAIIVYGLLTNANTPTPDVNCKAGQHYFLAYI